MIFKFPVSDREGEGGRRGEGERGGKSTNHFIKAEPLSEGETKENHK